ncbi:MAG: hypothetical protein WA190_00150 [Usitatibacter sp.]
MLIDRQSHGHAYSAWAVEASVRTGSGDIFHGRNGDLQLLNVERFVSALDAFVLNRRAPVQLEGTYDSFIRFSGSASGITIEFRIGAADHLSKSYVVSGAFSLDQEALLQVIGAFKEVASMSSRGDR